MLLDNFAKVYRHFRLQIYKDISTALKRKDNSLTVADFFDAEIILLLDKPTISEFAKFLDISSSHAAYKIKTLANKGYIARIPTADGRQFKLDVTDKFMKVYHEEDYFGNRIMREVAAKMNGEEVNIADDLLCKIVKELGENK